MSIRTFDQLTNEEIVALTEEQFKHFCALEMMSKGVVIPKAPAEVDEIAPKLPTKTYFRPKLNAYTHLGIVFATSEQATAFLALKPIQFDHNYSAGFDCFYAKETPDISFEACELSSQKDYEAAVVDLIRINSAKNQYQKDKAEYDKQAKAAAEAVEWMANRRATCLERQRNLERIKTVYAEYIALCEGDEHIARNFLGKRYNPSEIEEALGREEPVVRAAEHVES